MTDQVQVKICGTGTYLPGPAIPFDEVENVLGKITGAPRQVEKWFERIKPLLKEMIDIRYYHYAFDPDSGVYTDDNISMAVKAARSALEMAGMAADETGLITYGSAHQDQMPTASVRIQEALGIEQCGELSIHANCTSAYKALLLAYDLIANGRYKTALVVSSGIASSELRASYYNPALIRKEELFLRYFLCDGAGALVLKAAGKEEKGLFIKHAYMESIGGNKPAAMLNRRPSYWMNPKQEYDEGRHHLAQMFNEQLRAHFHDPDGSVFYKGLKRFIEKYSIDLGKLKFFQVNFPSKHISELIIEECEGLGIPPTALYSQMADMGYPGPPMALICLDHIVRNETLYDRDIILSFVTEVSKFMQAGYVIEYRS